MTPDATQFVVIVAKVSGKLRGLVFEFDPNCDASSIALLTKEIAALADKLDAAISDFITPAEAVAQ